MTFIPKPVKTGVALPTTYVWELSIINSLKIDDTFKDLLVRLYQNISEMNDAINDKANGDYDVQLATTNKLLFSSNPANAAALRPGVGRAVVFPALPNAGTISQPHGITCTTTTQFFIINGAASKQAAAFSYLPLPFASSVDVAHNIQVDVDATNVNITSGSNYSAYSGIIILELILQ